MAVRLSISARRELDEIGSFIAEDSPRRAVSFVSELTERCLGLARHAQRYPLAAIVKGVELRRCPFGKYIIFYAIDGDQIEIAHILHSARDYMAIVFAE